MTESPAFRTFIGIPLPSVVQHQLDDWLRLRGHIRSEPTSEARQIPATDRHITLHFLGNLTKRERIQLSQNLDQELERTTAFELRLEKMQHFPDAKSPIVAATCETTPALSHLWQSCAKALNQSNLQHLVSEREFRPHITLIRYKPHQRQYKAKDTDNLELAAINLPVQQVNLYDSQLSHSGSSYRPIHSIALNQ